MAIAVKTEGLCVVGPDGEAIGDADLMQGMWTQEQYLHITNHSKRMLEFTAGSIEVLPMPTRRHQLILRFFMKLLEERVLPIGIVMYAVFRMQIGEDKFREPDLLMLLDEQDPRNADDYWRGADLVAEVVSPNNPERDLVTKRQEYAEASVPEYWVINPLDNTVTVLHLQGEQYVEYGVFRRGDTATSTLMEGFGVDVSALFDAGKGRK